jgi:hypothetical protein
MAWMEWNAIQVKWNGMEWNGMEWMEWNGMQYRLNGMECNTDNWNAIQITGMQYR